MRTRKQFTAIQYNQAQFDSNFVSDYTNHLVAAVTGTYPKTSRLYKAVNKLLKAQQELSVLLAEEEGVINGGGDTAGVSGEVAGL